MPTSSVREWQTKLATAGYLADENVAVSVLLATALDKPLLVEGPPGVGKTELAKALAKVGDRQLIRLQCYEGLDETRALYEWQYGKQLLYAELLRERVADVVDGADSLAAAMKRLTGQNDVFFSREFLQPRPLLEALTSYQPAVLLIDEIDRADEAFEAFLLELLADFQVTIPELGTVSARVKPWVVLTANGTRRLCEALRRRCLYLYIDYPSADRELEIVRTKVPALEAQLAADAVQFVQRLRGQGLRKPPSVSETLDWAWTLVTLNAERLDRSILETTLGVLLKEHEDLSLALNRTLR